MTTTRPIAVGAQEQLRRLLAAHSQARVAARLGISTYMVVRAAAGGRISALAAEGLERRLEQRQVAR